MAPVALAFAVLDLSDSPSALGRVLAAQSIPLVVFLLVGGVIADRFDRAWLLRITNIGAGLSQGAIAALVLTGTAELWHLICLAAVNGTLAAVSFPAMASVVPTLVPREQLQPANVLLSMQRATLAVVGPSTAAVLVVTVGPGLGAGHRRGDLAGLGRAAARRPDPAPRPRRRDRGDVVRRRAEARAGRSSPATPGSG